jgi:hypothetical protein
MNKYCVNQVFQGGFAVRGKGIVEFKTKRYPQLYPVDTEDLKFVV